MTAESNIPALDAEGALAPAPAPSGSPSGGEAVRTRPLSVVVADDWAEIRFLVRADLECNGEFTVCAEAACGAEAVAAVEEQRPDVLLLDVSMPDTDALAVIAEVRRLSSTTRIVLHTGSVSPELALAAAAAGAAGCLEKGLGQGSMADKLSRVLEDAG